MITSTFFFIVFLPPVFPSPRTKQWNHHRQLKKRYIFVETFSPFILFDTFANEKWSDIYQQKLKLTYWWRLIKRTHFSRRTAKKKSVVLLMSLCRIFLLGWGVHYYGMISLIKHFTVYRFNLEWVMVARDFSIFIVFFSFPDFSRSEGNLSQSDKSNSLHNNRKHTVCSR